MNRRSVLLIAGAVIGIGAILILGAFIMSGFRVFSAIPKNSTAEQVEESYTFEKTIKSIDIEVIASDLRFERSGDGKTHVESRHDAQIKETVEVKNGTLTVRQEQAKKGFGIGLDLSFANDSLTIYLPGEDYDELCVATVSGKATMSGLHAETAQFETISGDIVLGEVRVDKDMEISAVSGDAELSGLRVGKELKIDTTSGDVSLVRCDAGEMEINTISGEVEGTLCSGKTFEIDTVSGEVNVPQNTAGAPLCKIDTTSGDVTLRIEN